MNSTSKVAIVAACIAAILSTVVLTGGKPGRSAEKKPDSSSVTGNVEPGRMSTADSPRSRRSSSSTRVSQGAKAGAIDLAELKSIMAGDEATRGALLDEYLANLDAEGARQVLEYLLSLGEDYWQEQMKSMMAWAKLDPEKAITWTQKNFPQGSEKVMETWLDDSSEDAIAWADADGATLGGNRYYSMMIKNFPDTYGRVEMATQMMLSQPMGPETNSDIGTVLSYAESEGDTSTFEWLDDLPKGPKREIALNQALPHLAERIPADTLDWLREPVFYGEEVDHRVFQVLRSAVDAGKVEEVSEYIENMPGGEEKTRFQNGLSHALELQQNRNVEGGSDENPADSALPPR